MTKQIVDDAKKIAVEILKNYEKTDVSAVMLACQLVISAHKSLIKDRKARKQVESILESIP